MSLIGKLFVWLQLLILSSTFGGDLSCHAFIVVPRHDAASPTGRCRFRRPAASKYVPPELANGDGTQSSATKQRKPLYPKVGDIVRYYDLDGGKIDGQVLVGKITFIQERLVDAAKQQQQQPMDHAHESAWLVEVTQMDDLGDGFFADFPGRQRQKKKKLRDLTAISPIAASFVRVENAYRIPLDAHTGQPKVRAEQYDIDGYQGPFRDPDNQIDQSVLDQDAVIYARLKGKLLRWVAITGLAGTIVTDLVTSLEDAVIYFGGVLASLVYLLLLSLKADTIGVRTQSAQLARNLSALRFAMPLLLFVGVALYDYSLGDASPLPTDHSIFDTVTKEQFVAAALGFVTYRIPLFVIQVQEAFRSSESGDDMILPGSAGIALQLAKKSKEEASKSSSSTADAAKTATATTKDGLSTILLVSGPQATGRSALVQRLIDSGKGQFVALEPTVDRVKDGAAFERLEQRSELLQMDPTGRFGWTKAGIQQAAQAAAAVQGSSENGNDGGSSGSVLVVDANVDFARQLTLIPGLRIIGVWVGLASMAAFEQRLEAELAQGTIRIPDDETKESVLRARIKQIVKEIEFGISSGIFEFTILNENEEDSLQELREAAAYCFR